MATESPAPVVLLDDSAYNLAVMEQTLQGLTGLEIFKTQKSDEALAFLQSRDVALVVMDINMPTSGFQVQQQMKQDNRLRHVPIVFVTGTYRDNKAIMLQAYNLGAADVQFKPFEPPILIAKVKVFADLWREKQRLIEEYEEKLADEKRQQGRG